MKFLAIVAALIIPPALYFPTMAKQNQEQQARADEELSQLDQQLQKIQATQQKMAQFLEESRRVSAELEGLRVTLPPKVSVSEILRTLQDAAMRNGVQLTRFTPRQPVSTPPYQSVSIDAEVDGNIAAIEALIHELDSEPRPGQRLLTVTEIQMSGEHSRFVLTGYALPDP